MISSNMSPNIISVSRRTDIPRFYARWFGERRREGYAEFRNVFGCKGTVSLQDEDVLGYLFWTRYARPFTGQLRSLMEGGIPFVFQYTINGYGKGLEPYSPQVSKAIDDFLATHELMPSPACIQWRYDPIVLSKTFPESWHIENFSRIVAALKGSTKVVNVSFIEPYRKAIRRVADHTVIFRQVDVKRHKTVAADSNILQINKKQGRRLLGQLAAIAALHGMELRICSNPEWQFPASQCCGVELFNPYGEKIARRITALKPGPSRSACRCCKTVDIGMDNTCPSGCMYCYVVTSQTTARRNFMLHRPSTPMLR